MELDEGVPSSPKRAKSDHGDVEDVNKEEPINPQLAPTQEEDFSTTTEESSSEEPFMQNPLPPFDFDECNALPSSYEDCWDELHVRWPCSARFQYRKKSDPDAKLWKWPLIAQALAQSISCPSQLTLAINTYQTKKRSPSAFCHYLRSLGSEEFERFFGHTLRNIQSLVLQTPFIFPRALYLLLPHKQVKQVVLTRQQCACIVANMFMGTFPPQKATKKKQEKEKGGEEEEEEEEEDLVFPTTDMRILLEGSHGLISPSNSAKLDCFLSYLDRCNVDGGEETISFCRRSLDVVLDWNDSSWMRQFEFRAKSFMAFHDGAIEDAWNNACQVDFANKVVGGGVLSNGCIQEEIRFATAPELLITRLLCSQLEDNETLLVSGFRTFCATEGYSDSFRFRAPMEEKRREQLVVMDAKFFGSRLEARRLQFSKANIDRELGKCVSGFSFPGMEHDQLATGNWGCGHFGGSHRLKAIIQMMSACVCDKKLQYYTFGMTDLAQELTEFHQFLVDNSVSVPKLYDALLQFDGSTWDPKNDVAVLQSVREHFLTTQ